MVHFTNTDNPIDFPKARGMNERIKELADAALIPFKDENSFECYHFSKELFAKLIIRECANICLEGIVTDTDWDHSYWDQACENRALAIKQHFGVE